MNDLAFQGLGPTVVWLQKEKKLTDAVLILDTQGLV